MINFNFLNKKIKIKNLKVLTFGTNKRADVYPVSIIHNKSKILIVNVKNQKVKIKFKHINIYNILSALALIYELKLSFKKIYHYIKNLEPSDGRGKIHIVRRYNKKFTLVDESYNANPLSVKIALKNFNSIKI